MFATVGLGSAADEDIWRYARRQGLILVSKDGDFHQRSFLLGPPPKFVWLRVGNCTTAEIESLLRGRAAQIAAFLSDDAAAVLILDRLA
ncbi:MAG TPA: DUF5615 family PIN-like protein [Afifellaceae bacterium]|nr:DUF5615 family PIN-like protein [Afifellaceae bacterium]